MKVVILCGGLGTRLREETEHKPKPMVDVGGRPLLWHIMKLYAHHGFTDFVMCLGYKGHVIKDYFLRYEEMNNDFTIHLGRESRLEVNGCHNEQDYRVTVADTGLNTMTGGRLKRARRYFGSETFMDPYGDGVSDVNVADLVRFHRSHGRLATLTTVQAASRFGVVETDGNEVVGFHEKPHVEGWINAGFFVFEPAVLDCIDGDEAVLEGKPLEKLAAEKQLMAYRHAGFFYAMDTYREYLHLNQLWDTGQAPWKVWA